MNYVSVTEAAKMLGVSRQRVQELINADVLKAEKIGYQWAVSRKSVEERIASKPKGGRPFGT